MNWDEELEAVQARMQQESLWRNAVAAGAMGSAYAEAWFNSLTPEQQEMLQEMIEEQCRRIKAFFDDFRASIEEMGRDIGERLMPAIRAFGVAADDLRRRENRRRLYWDGKMGERVGRYRPYRSRKAGR